MFWVRLIVAALASPVTPLMEEEPPLYIAVMFTGIFVSSIG